jgi:hypothetical protein
VATAVRIAALGFALGVAASACRAERYPWDDATPTGSLLVVASAAPRPLASLGLAPADHSALPFEAPPIALSGAPFVRCSEGFVPSRDPLRDATRLGLSCGPSTGMVPALEPHEGAIAQERTDLRLPLRLTEGACYRVHAVGDEGIAELDAELVSSRGVTIARDHAEGRVATIHPDRPVCAVGDDDATIVVRAREGSGRAAVSAWRLVARASH